MRYVVLMNYKYMNSFENYSDACDLRDRLHARFKTASIEIISYGEFKGR